MSSLNRLHPKSYFVAVLKALHFGVLFLAICGSSAPAHEAPPVPANIMAVNGLILRVLPQQADRFSVELTPATDGLDVFEIEAKAERIVLHGNSGRSIAMAFNRYLRYEAKVNFDWQAAGPLESMVRCCNPKKRTAGNAPPRNGSSLTIALMVIPCRGGNETNGSASSTGWLDQAALRPEPGGNLWRWQRSRTEAHKGDPLQSCNPDGTDFQG